MMSAVPRLICEKVDTRDHYACVRCGKSLHVTSGSRHHRQRRAIGGHQVSNVILLCGSGTTGCHGWVHAHPREARAAGWIVRAEGLVAPETTPVQVVAAGQGSPLIWVMLSPQGRQMKIPDTLAHSMIGPNL